VKCSVFVLTLIGRSDDPSTVNTTRRLETLCLHTNGLYDRSVQSTAWPTLTVLCLQSWAVDYMTIAWLVGPLYRPERIDRFQTGGDGPFAFD